MTMGPCPAGQIGRSARSAGTELASLMQLGGCLVGCAGAGELEAVPLSASPAVARNASSDSAEGAPGGTGPVVAPQALTRSVIASVVPSVLIPTPPAKSTNSFLRSFV